MKRLLRLVLARMVLDHRLRPRDPFSMGRDDDPAAVALLGESPITLGEAQALVAT